MSLPPITPEKIQYMYYWDMNAKYFKEQGCYKWMCEQVAFLKPARILEIGCGTGQGVEALLESFNAHVVSIEENQACMLKAADLLDSSYQVHLDTRYGYQDVGNDEHIIHVSDRKLKAPAQVNFLQGDVLLGDVELFSFLEQLPKFDLVTIWLMGTYKMRSNCVNLRGSGISSPEHYRLLSQNRTYELADRVLRSGGALQVVDRGLPISSDAQRQAMIDSHKEQASVTSLEFETLTFRNYKEPTDRGVGMVGRDLKQFKGDLIMTSVISLKP